MEVFMKHTPLVLALMSVFLCFGPSAFSAEITVSAAASLSNAFTDIAKSFEKATGIKVALNFASSNNLLRQMESGAPVDVFASADQETMDKAESKKISDPQTRKNFALNDLVLIVPAGHAAVKDAKGLASEKISRIAIGKPESVPAGRYAKASLEHSGVWESLQAKFIFGDNVRQVLNYVQRGEVDAGFVYRTDALTAPKDVAITAVMEGHKPVSYPIAVCLTGKDAESGKKFIEYVLSSESQDVLSRYGFSKP